MVATVISMRPMAAVPGRARAHEYDGSEPLWGEIRIQEDGGGECCRVGRARPLGLRIPELHYHPKSVAASLEDLQELSSTLSLDGRVPSRNLFDDQERCRFE